jgi:hypothetical protein
MRHTGVLNSSRSGLTRRGATGMFPKAIRGIAAFLGLLACLLALGRAPMRSVPSFCERSFGSAKSCRNGVEKINAERLGLRSRLERRWSSPFAYRAVTGCWRMKLTPLG